VRVALLAGGRSSEHDVSLASAAAVRSGLEQGGHEPVSVEISRDGRWTRGGSPVVLDPGGGLLGCDVAFPVLHGPYGEDGTVQGLLEALGVPYVGAGVLTSALCMDKVLFKDLMAAAGLPQVRYVAHREGDDEAPLADAVVHGSSAAAVRAPVTTLGDLLALSARAALMVSGDTGPVHIAAAMRTPIVGLYGPTWPERNGPWDADDIVVSRAEACECHHKRECRRGAAEMCLNEISIESVKDAVDLRLQRAARGQ